MVISLSMQGERGIAKKENKCRTCLTSGSLLSIGGSVSCGGVVARGAVAGTISLLSFDKSRIRSE
jgi:hypothetical protein